MEGLVGPINPGGGGRGRLERTDGGESWCFWITFSQLSRNRETEDKVTLIYIAEDSEEI